jgi:hypothetical protein
MERTYPSDEQEWSFDIFELLDANMKSFDTLSEMIEWNIRNELPSRYYATFNYEVVDNELVVTIAELVDLYPELE